RFGAGVARGVPVVDPRAARSLWPLVLVLACRPPGPLSFLAPAPPDQGRSLLLRVYELTPGGGRRPAGTVLAPAGPPPSLPDGAPFGVEPDRADLDEAQLSAVLAWVGRAHPAGLFLRGVAGVTSARLKALEGGAQLRVL